MAVACRDGLAGRAVAVLLAVLVVLGDTAGVQIVGLIRTNETTAELGIRDAVGDINTASIFPFQLTAVIERANTAEGCITGLCKSLTRPTLGVVGPTYSYLATEVAVPLQRLGMPAVSPSSVDPALSSAPFIHRLMPSMEIQGIATNEVIKHAGWRRVVLLSSDNSYGVRGVQSLLREMVGSGVVVSVHTFEAAQPQSTLKQKMAEWRKADMRVFVLHAYEETADTVLSLAQEAGIFGERRVWILPYMYSNYWNALPPSRKKSLIGLIGVSAVVPTRNATLDAMAGGSETYSEAYDAVWSIAHAAGKVPGIIPFSTTDCSIRENTSWTFGDPLLGALRTVAFTGRTGQVAFSEFGREGVEFQLLNMRESPTDGGSVIAVGSLGTARNWRVALSTPDLQWSDYSRGLPWPTSGIHIQGREFTVLTGTAPPFVMYDEATGNLRGYSIDFMNALSERMNFTVVYKLTKLRASQNIAEIERLNSPTTIYIAAATITVERSQVVDFTQPYYHLGFRLLVAAPHTALSLWRFLAPFSPGVWLLWLTLVLVVAVGYTAFEKPHRRSKEDGVWFASTVMLQGGDLMPKTPAGRVLGFAAMFMSTILVAAYTASLAAFLSRRDGSYKVDSYKDVVSGDVEPDRVGIIENTAYASWFTRERPGVRAYSPPSYGEMYNLIANGSLDVGVVDSPIAEYAASRDCRIVTRGEVFEPAGYGIVLMKNSPFTPALSSAVLDLNREGVGGALYEKYFVKNKCRRADDDPGAVRRLSVVEMAGSFVVALGIICVAVVVHVVGWHQAKKKTTFYGASDISPEGSEDRLDRYHREIASLITHHLGNGPNPLCPRTSSASSAGNGSVHKGHPLDCEEGPSPECGYSSFRTPPESRAAPPRGSGF
eukprot:Sspe_Gene.79379::Locus_49772_Transcript_1_1_Confidence_1.000_Length_2906::g.79379::m.79379